MLSHFRHFSCTRKGQPTWAPGGPGANHPITQQADAKAESLWVTGSRRPGPTAASRNPHWICLLPLNHFHPSFVGTLCFLRMLALHLWCMLQIFSPALLFVFWLRLWYLMPRKRCQVLGGSGGGGGDLSTLPFTAPRLEVMVRKPFPIPRLQRSLPCFLVPVSKRLSSCPKTIYREACLCSRGFLHVVIKSGPELSVLLRCSGSSRAYHTTALYSASCLSKCLGGSPVCQPLCPTWTLASSSREKLVGIFIEITSHTQMSVGKGDILMILKHFNQEQGMPFHAIKSTFVSFRKL